VYNLVRRVSPSFFREAIMAAIAEVSTETFAQTIASDKPTLVDFWAPWCGPCRMLAPVVEELADEMAGKLAFAKCNVDDNEDIAMQYGVMSIPTLIIFKGGKEVSRTVGSMPKAQLAKEIEKAL
jgi:thioredoxin 1